ncbi:hypothetical protein DERP_013661 [Dermatophagoides pteronyssinus]|uniref:Uncharacterized protein n=1 Tax=Dermatophagoides pteronyssinus TaxID=6956 RepID=A0ABQ8JV68_DERPT|nr:hypothetical protein DERP_013661 [Dermatophagoides pteronyssinus]
MLYITNNAALVNKSIADLVAPVAVVGCSNVFAVVVDDNEFEIELLLLLLTLAVAVDFVTFIPVVIVVVDDCGGG